MCRFSNVCSMYPSRLRLNQSKWKSNYRKSKCVHVYQDVGASLDMSRDRVTQLSRSLDVYLGTELGTSVDT